MKKIKNISEALTELNLACDVLEKFLEIMKKYLNQ